MKSEEAPVQIKFGNIGAKVSQAALRHIWRRLVLWNQPIWAPCASLGLQLLPKLRWKALLNFTLKL